MIKILTDTTSSFTLEEFLANDIGAFPLYVTQGDESRQETFELSYDEFYRLQRAGTKFITSQPNLNNFIEAFRSIISAGDEAICIMISKEISGSFNTALLAQKILQTDKISVLDSLQSGLNQAYLAIEAKRMAESGMNRSQIVSALMALRSRNRVYFIVESLRYLYEGGRINGLQTILGSVIQIKPLIWFDPTGKMSVFEKIRTLKAAKQRVTALLQDDATQNGIEHIGLHYGDNLTEAREYAQELEAIAGIPVSLVRLSPVIATHTGPDILGVCYTIK